MFISHCVSADSTIHLINFYTRRWKEQGKDKEKKVVVSIITACPTLSVINFFDSSPPPTDYR